MAVDEPLRSLASSKPVSRGREATRGASLREQQAARAAPAAPGTAPQLLPPHQGQAHAELSTEGGTKPICF